MELPAPCNSTICKIIWLVYTNSVWFCNVIQWNDNKCICCDDLMYNSLFNFVMRVWKVLFIQHWTCGAISGVKMKLNYSFVGWWTFVLRMATHVILLNNYVSDRLLSLWTGVTWWKWQIVLYVKMDFTCTYF